jgi:arabinogalactan endo-1,4-beta-galactosidase
MTSCLFLLFTGGVKISRRHFLLGSGVALSTLTSIPELHASKTRSLSNGADISWLPEVEAAGGKFYDAQGRRIDAVALLKLSGVKVGRIRVFVNPQTENGSLKRAIALAKRLKAHGLEICVDLHYSDTWADPAHQTMPAGWSNEIDKLEKEIYDYTYKTLQQFVHSGVMPQWVQIGNEVAGGFLWPIGKLTSDDASEWQNFVRLQNAGIQALWKAVPKARSIVHLECGGDYQRVRWWLNSAQRHGLNNYDILGLSYYSQWSGSLNDLSKTLDIVTSEFKKPVVIAETAYPWSSQRFGNDVIDTDKALLVGHPMTPSGQKKFVLNLEKLLRQQPGNRGLGLWWWEPMAIQVRAASGAITWNGGMANSALVDSQGRALPALSALNGQ